MSGIEHGGILLPGESVLSRLAHFFLESPSRKLLEIAEGPKTEVPIMLLLCLSSSLVFVLDFMSMKGPRQSS